MTDYRKILMLRSKGCSQREMERSKVASREKTRNAQFRSFAAAISFIVPPWELAWMVAGEGTAVIQHRASPP